MPVTDRTLLQQYLAQIHYCRVLDSDAIQTIAAEAIAHTYSPDQLIFSEGDESRGLWIIEDGNVKISKLNPEGTEYILHLLGPGSSFNDIAALDGGPTPANAIAINTVIVWSIPARVMSRILEQYPKVMRAALNMLTGRVRALTRQIEDLTLYPVIVRLARFLLAQAENPVLSGPGITRAAIAAHLATTPETISRMLVRIQEAGAIRFDRHRIVIVDEKLLRLVASL